MRLKIILQVVILCGTVVFAAYGAKPKVIKVEGSSIVYGDKNMSPTELENKAIFEAQKDAIDKAFGIKVSSTQTLIVTDQETVSSQSTSQLKGEWIETTDCDLSPLYQIEAGRFAIECSIKGLAREISSEQIDFEAVILKNAPNRKFESPDGVFNDGDELYVFFKSPVSGYLNIYLLDESRAYCLLPYWNSVDGAYFVEADKEYIFFSPQTDKKHADEVDQYILHSDNMAVEINTLDFYFSPSKFNKGKMNVDEKDPTRPKDASLDDYAKWKTKLLMGNDYVTIRTINLKIYNNEN